MNFEQWLKANNITVRPCNCGGVQPDWRHVGTGHAPGCAHEDHLEQLHEQWQDDEAQDEGYDEGMGQGGDAYTDVMYGDSPDY